MRPSPLLYVIKKYQLWTIALHPNQSYLGRAICFLNANKKLFIELNDKESLELRNIIAAYQIALAQLWQPDWWNYAQLGNKVRHLHIHFIPRYKKKRIFNGIEFIDNQWGHNYAPAPRKQENRKLNQQITQAIKRALNNES